MSTGGTLFWAIICVTGIALIAPELTHEEEARTAPVAAPAPGPRADDEVEDRAPRRNDDSAYVVERSDDGHFYADADVNGARIRFMIDTGASVVALTPRDAERAGIVSGSRRATARGAGGEVEVAPVTIDRISLGPLDARDVRGAIAEQLPVSLLGQSFLAEADSVEMRGDEMLLR
jgi:aspartyl protease family protein